MADADSIQTLIEVTGLEAGAAKRVLEVCNNDLERAINFHLEGHVVDEIAGDLAGASNAALSNVPDQSAALAVPYSNEDGVREPIPVKREQLINAEDDNFRTRHRRPMSHNVCPLRNFQLEGELQEAQLSEVFGGNRSASMVAAALTRSSRSGTSINTQNPKRPRLGDLFRPPVDISFAGTLHSVREAGKVQDKWIIVNLQDNSQFASQCMNRDIWSDKTLKSLIRSFFLFWQVATDTSEGARFQSFYGARKMPYVCILDPRTGEEKRNYKNDSDEDAFKFTAAQFVSELKKYLDENHSCPSGEDNEGAFGAAATCVDISDNAIDFPEQNGAKSKHKRTADTLDEDEQLRIAIANSLRESKMAEESTSSSSASGSGNSSRNGNKVRRTEAQVFETLEFDSDSDGDFDSGPSSQKSVAAPTETPSVDYTNYLGASDDPITRIQLRLPDGRRDNLEWPCSSQIQALRTYVENRYPDVTSQPYKIICAFPRQDLLTLDATETLLSTKLHPNALLHLHQDD